MADRGESSGQARVTMAQIAELADKSPSAASNWRRRFDDFPQPVGTEAGRDVFSIDEAERWLLKYNRFSPDRHRVLVLWKVTDMVRGFLSVDQIVEFTSTAVTFLHVLQGQGLSLPTKWPAAKLHDKVLEAEKASGEQGLFLLLLDVPRELLARVLTQVSELSPDDLPDLFEDVLERQSRFVATRTGDDLTKLMVLLGISTDTKSVFDPAAGEGGFLIAAMRRTVKSQRSQRKESSTVRTLRKLAQLSLKVYGQEIDPRAWRIAAQRLRIHGLEADVRQGDSLSHDAFFNREFDVVLCDPPYGSYRTEIGIGPDPRWEFGLPPKKSGDFAWLQHAIAHLSESGRAYVVLPSGSLQRKGQDEQIRREIVRRGAVEAVIALPTGTAEHTAIPLALWVVRRPSDDPNPGSVLVVDGVGMSSGSRGIDDGVIERVQRILTTWRAVGEISEGDANVARGVPVLELLGRDADLLPVRWIHEVQATSRDITEEIELLHDQIRKMGDPAERFIFDPAVAVGAREQWTPIRTLATQEIAEVIRGIRIKPEQCVSEGIRAIRTRDFANGGISEDAPCHVEPNDLGPNMALTQPGDILVSPGSGTPKAVVDEVGGRVLVSPVQGLRLREGWIDLKVAAAFLMSPRNRRFMAGTNWGYARLDLRDLELPLLTLEQGEKLRSALDQLAELERMGRELADSASQLRESLLSADVSKGEGN
jgi:N-6 DNA Methylase